MTKEFPNNWQGVHDTDHEMFPSIEYDAFMEFSTIWEIPSSHSCIMRVHNTRTDKVKEYAYKRVINATKKLAELIDDPDNVITVCDDESIHYLVHPENERYHLR